MSGSALAAALTGTQPQRVSQGRSCPAHSHLPGACGTAQHVCCDAKFPRDESAKQQTWLLGVPPEDAQVGFNWDPQALWMQLACVVKDHSTIHFSVSSPL
jgi:hypothetical protein